MKTKLTLVILLLLAITPGVVFCQTGCNCFVTTETGSEPFLSGELFEPASSPAIVTYFNKDWLSGDIWLTDGRIVRNKKIKYNGLLDELFWFESRSNQTVKLDKEAILQFHFLNFQGDTTVNFRKIKVKRDILSDSSEIFVQEIFRGKLSLLVFHSFYFAGREAVRMNNSSFLKEIYKEEPVYYLRSPDNRIAEFKRFNRRNIYAHMPDKKDQIRKYFRDSISGRIKTDQEIIGFVQFLSSIID
jgi:hypothetical protein